MTKEKSLSIGDIAIGDNNSNITINISFECNQKVNPIAKLIKWIKTFLKIN